MQRRQIGVVGALWRYPVKSMRGEQLSAAVVTQYGLAGDRAWALRETEYGGVVSARTWPAMLQMRASWTPDRTPDPLTDACARISIEMPDGMIVNADDSAAGDSAASRALSAFLRREVRLERVHREPITPAEREAIMRGEAMPPARDFFDEEVMHLIATGTLAHLRALIDGASDFDPRRFRANIIVDTGADADGFIEDGWLDGVLEVGADVLIVGMRPALRCAITTHPQDPLPHDPAILRIAWRFHQAYAGIFAAVGAEGTIRVGDPIYLRALSRGS
jgi:MOSC domain-containing protein